MPGRPIVVAPLNTAFVFGGVIPALGRCALAKRRSCAAAKYSAAYSAAYSAVCVVM